MKGVSSVYGEIEMKNAVLIGWILFLVSGLTSPIKGGPPAHGTGQTEWEKIEHFLETAAVTDISKNLESGRTDFWSVTLSDGKETKKAIFKYINRKRPRILPDSYKYELAAYTLSRLLDLHIVPVTVARTIDGITGSLQLFIEGCIKESERQNRSITPPDPQRFQDQVDEINVFEALVSDHRQDSDDMLIKCPEWILYRIDFSEAFSPQEDLPAAHPLQRCSKKLYTNLQNVKDYSIIMALAPYLNEEERQSLLRRKTSVINTLKTIIRDKGRDKVLF
jgi:hypothetical protein